MKFYNSFLEFYRTKYPDLFAASSSSPVPALLVSPGIIPLKKEHLTKIKDFIAASYQLSHSSKYLESFKQVPSIATHSAPNASVFMSYDFHITPEGPKLIEINTNAAQSSLSALIREFQSPHLEGPFAATEFFDEVKKNVIEEFHSLTPNKMPRIVITDENPAGQRAFSEFLIYKNLFEKWGWQALIEDCSHLSFDINTQTLRSQQGTEFDFVYNRTTDFYLEGPSTKGLREAYLSGRVCVSPNPKEYFRLADKDRMLNFSNKSWLEGQGLSVERAQLFLDIVPTTLPVSEFSLDTQKEVRKKFVFKPRQSFGGKAVYKGASISNKVFAEILEKDYIAQQFVEPGTVSIQIDDQTPQEFKYDIRAYAYKDRLTLLAGRTYQGQITNTQTMGGGMAAVKII